MICVDAEVRCGGAVERDGIVEGGSGKSKTSLVFNLRPTHQPQHPKFQVTVAMELWDKLAVALQVMEEVAVC